jgi:hypothetical protein
MITFLAQPNTIEPVYGNLVFQFESDKALDPQYYKYRYVVDVFTNRGSTPTNRLFITPSPEGWGQVDLSSILYDFTSSVPQSVGCDIPIHEIGWGYLNDNMIIYDIRVGEEYTETPNGIVVLYNGQDGVGNPNVRSEVCYTYNGVKEWYNGKNFNFQPFYLTGQTGDFPQYSSMFMTNSPRTRYIRETDQAVLGAFNWYSATETELFDPIDYSRQIYSALFTYYDVSNNILGTNRTYNVEANCGTRPNCAWYDGWFDTPDNFPEQQVVYLGVGIPNQEQAHGFSVPPTTKYWKVELEGLQSQPTPPAPEIADFDGCSCHNYSYTNPFDESIVVWTYLDCVGDQQSITANTLGSISWCACQNTNSPSISTEIALDLGECDVCECITYSIENPTEESGLFSYTNCSGDTITAGIESLETLEVCACDGSVIAVGYNVSELGVCPLPFSADCRQYAVSYSAATPYTYTFTGCCGTEQTAIIPPSTSFFLKINYPAPTPPGITATLLGSATPDPCPEPAPPAVQYISGGTAIIGLNVCDGVSLQFFQYYGDPIQQGVFFNWNNTIYEFIEVGGGGFIDLTNPYIFSTQAQALSAFPCPTYATGSCLNTIVISEPFYFYMDEVCSHGDRNLFFMGKYGTYEYYNFREKEDTGYGINKQEYQSAPELYNQGWDSNSYYGWASKRNVWANNVVKSGVLYTAPLPQAESIWLSEELFSSPSVYMIGDNGVLEPILITNSEVVIPNYQINSNLYQVSIEYKSQYDTTRQSQE